MPRHRVVVVRRTPRSRWFFSKPFQGVAPTGSLVVGASDSFVGAAYVGGPLAPAVPTTQLQANAGASAVVNVNTTRVVVLHALAGLLGTTSSQKIAAPISIVSTAGSFSVLVGQKVAPITLHAAAGALGALNAARAVITSLIASIGALGEARGQGVHQATISALAGALGDLSSATTRVVVLEAKAGVSSGLSTQGIHNAVLNAVAGALGDLGVAGIHILVLDARAGIQAALTIATTRATDLRASAGIDARLVAVQAGLNQIIGQAGVSATLFTGPKTVTVVLHAVVGAAGFAAPGNSIHPSRIVAATGPHGDISTTTIRPLVLDARVGAGALVAGSSIRVVRLEAMAAALQNLLIFGNRSTILHAHAGAWALASKQLALPDLDDLGEDSIWIVFGLDRSWIVE